MSSCKSSGENCNSWGVKEKKMFTLMSAGIATGLFILLVSAFWLTKKLPFLGTGIGGERAPSGLGVFLHAVVVFGLAYVIHYFLMKPGDKDKCCCDVVV